MAAAHPLRDMMESLTQHYDLRWDVQDTGFLLSHLSSLNPARLNAFLDCHHGSHPDCAATKEVATVNCWEMVAWAVSLAFLGEYYPRHGDAGAQAHFLDWWFRSPFFAAIHRAFSHHTSVVEYLDALQALFGPFLVMDDAKLLRLFHHAVGDLLASNPPRQPHALPVDSVLAFDAYEFPTSAPSHTPLSQYVQPVASVLRQVAHKGITVSSDPADVWDSTTEGLEQNGLYACTLRKMCWYQALQPGHHNVLGHLLVLDMSPQAVMRIGMGH
jgi:hypothetical protein